MLSAVVDSTILLHLAGALILGSIVGYERYFRGRASGTQVYGIVSMASCAVTIENGRFTLQLTILTDPHRHANALSRVSSDFRALPNVESFTAARSTI